MTAPDGPPARGPGRVAELLEPLRQPGLRRLTAAFLVNELGDGITSIVFPLAVYATTDSGVLTGLSFAAVRGAGLFGSPIGGVLADRFDRVAVLRASFVVRALLLGTALVVGREAVVLGCLLLVRIGGTVDNAAAEAAVREHAAERPRAVATIRKVATAVSWLVGPAVGGVLVSVLGVTPAIAVDLATFVAALALLARRPEPPPTVATTTAPTPAASRPTPSPATPPAARVPVDASSGPAPRDARGVIAFTVADARAGLAHLRSHPDLRLVVASTTANALLVAALLTAAVVYLGGLAGAPEGAYGFAMASYATGSLAGLLVAGSIAWQAPLATIVRRSLLVYGVVCVAGVVVPDWRVLAASWLLWGLAYGPEEIVSDVALVTHTAPTLLGRTYAGVTTAASAGQVVGAVVGGVLGDLVGPRILVAGLGATYVPLAAWVWWWTTRNRVAPTT